MKPLTITLELPPEVEARVQTEAARQEMPVSDYLLRLVTEAVITPEEAAKRQRSLELLNTLRDIGDEAEQKATFATLKTAVDADRLSDRKRFAP